MPAVSVIPPQTSLEKPVLAVCFFLYLYFLLFTLDESRGEKEITVLMESYSSSLCLTLLHTQSKLTMGLIGGAGQAARD